MHGSIVVKVTEALLAKEALLSKALLGGQTVPESQKYY
jgi:hypothetical protein